MSVLWKNFFRRDVKKIKDYLKDVPIFETLSDRELGRLERYMLMRSYTGGEHVFHQLEPGAGMYVLLAGEVAITLEVGVDQPTELVTLSEGDFFGEMALLDEAPRSAAAVSKGEKVELLSFFRGDLQKLMNEEPTIAVKILWNIGTVLSARLRKSNEAAKQK